MAVRKYLPYEFFEVDAVEAWLDEQARKGLSLQKVTGRFCRFERTAPHTARYRVNVPSKQDMQTLDERKAAYREMGWEYVTPLTDKSEIYRALSPDAVELNTDEEVLDETLHGVLKNQLIGEIVAGVLYLLVILHNLAIMLKNGFYTSILDGGIWMLFLMPLCIVAICLSPFFNIQPLIAIRKRKLLARDYHTSKIYSQRRRRSLFTLLILFAIGFSAIMINIDNSAIWEDTTDDDYRPLLTLDDFSPEEAKDAQQETFSCDFSLQNVVTYRQDGPNNIVYKSDTESIHHPIFYYSIGDSTIRWNWLAVRYAREHTKDWTPVEISGYDGAWYCEGEEPFTAHVSIHCQTIALLKGNEFIEIDYGGPAGLASADLRDAIPMLAR